jgi:hypothetical protein
LTGLFGIGERVRVLLDTDLWQNAGWVEGRVVAIEPYSAHRSFYWVELDAESDAPPGSRARLVSVLNPKKIQKIEESRGSKE